MGSAYSSSCSSSSALTAHSISSAFPFKSLSKPSTKPFFRFIPTNRIFQTHLLKPINIMSQPSQVSPLKSGKAEGLVSHVGFDTNPVVDFHGIDQKLVDKMVYDALIWSSLHGLVIGNKSVPAKDITDLGSLKAAAKIFVPGGATLYSARTIKIKEEEGFRTYYYYEFGQNDQHVALFTAVNSGKAIIAGATAPQSKWVHDGVKLRSAAISMTVL